MKKLYDVPSWKILIIILIFACNFLTGKPVIAKQSTNATPWGYSGLINMPVANVLETGEFYLSGSYLFKNPGFIGNAYIGIFDRLELGIVGGFPSESFTGLAGNIKYQLIRPSAKSPTALSAGINLLGINLVGSSKTNPLTTGNSLYMVLSHDFNWNLKNNNIYNLFSGHIGFGGNLDGARLMVGLDVPVTDLINLEGEYLGKIGNFNDMINFGIKGKPLPFLSISFLTIGTSPVKGFENTEYLINIAFNAKIPALQTVNEDITMPNKPDKITENPAPTPSPLNTFKPVPDKTPIPAITPEPEPTFSPEPVKTPVPDLTQTPKPVLTPVTEPTPEAIPVSNFGTLKGRVTGISGKKLPQKVSVTMKGLKGKFNSRLITESDGKFTFTDVPQGEYILIFEKEGYMEARRQLLIKPGDTTESIVELSAVNGLLSGRVIDLKGNPLPGITLVLDKGKKEVSDKDGKFGFNDLSVGYHLLSVYRESKEIKSLDLDIMSGTELKKEIVLDSEPKKDTVTNKNSIIIGKITTKGEPLKGARIMMEGDKLTVMTISGQDGKYVVKNLPVGSYKMTVSKAGFTPRIFSVKIKENQEARHDVELKQI